MKARPMTKTRFPQLLALGAAAMLAGCSMIPKYDRPAAPVADQYPTASGWIAESAQTQPAANTPAAADIEWQTFFSDPQLRKLIDAALRNNRDLRIAVLNIEQARAQYRIQRADQFPTINAGITGSRQPNANGNGSITSAYTGGLLMTSYELDFFGRVASLKEAALAQYLATEEGRKTTQISLIAAVANTYLSLLADEELLAITQQTLATREESFKLSKLRFDNGVTSELDFRQAESLTEAARVSLAQQVRQRALDQNALTLADRAASHRRAGRGPAGRQRPGRCTHDGRRARGPAFRPADAPPRRAPGRATAAVRQCRHRRGARGLLPAHFAHGQRRQRQFAPERTLQERLLRLDHGAAADPAAV